MSAIFSRTRNQGFVGSRCLGRNNRGFALQHSVFFAFNWSNDGGASPNNRISSPPGQLIYPGSGSWDRHLGQPYGSDGASANLIASPKTFTTVSRSRTANQATIVTAEANSFIVGELIQGAVSGLGGTGYNGNFTLNVIDANTFRYGNTGSNESTTSDTGGRFNTKPFHVTGIGTIDDGPDLLHQQHGPMWAGIYDCRILQTIPAGKPDPYASKLLFQIVSDDGVDVANVIDPSSYTPGTQYDFQFDSRTLFGNMKRFRQRIVVSGLDGGSPQLGLGEGTTTAFDITGFSGF